MIIRPPDDKLPKDIPSVFLAGSIEMGKAADWQQQVASDLRFKHDEYNDARTSKKSKLAFFNPRRHDWDSSWSQDMRNPNFRHQVEWEMSRLEYCDFIAVHFEGETMSPITLLELGWFGALGKPMAVSCPPNFWRKGNVDIFCNLNGITLVESVEDLILEIEVYFKYRAPAQMRIGV